MHLSALNERALAVRTPSPLDEQRQRQSQQQQQQQPPHSNSANNLPPRPKRRPRFACCTQPMVLEDQESTGTNGDGSFNSPQHKKGHFLDAFSPRRSIRAGVLTQQGSACYSDAEW